MFKDLEEVPHKVKECPSCHVANQVDLTHCELCGVSLTLKETDY